MFRPDDHVQKDDDESEAEKDENENENNEDDIETFRLSEIEPAFGQVLQTMEKANKLVKSTTMLKFEYCEFIAKNQNELNMHKRQSIETKAIRFFSQFL